MAEEWDKQKLVGDAIVLERAERVIRDRWLRGTHPTRLTDMCDDLAVMARELRRKAEIHHA